MVATDRASQAIPLCMRHASQLSGESKAPRPPIPKPTNNRTERQERKPDSREFNNFYKTGGKHRDPSFESPLPKAKPLPRPPNYSLIYPKYPLLIISAIKAPLEGPWGMGLSSRPAEVAAELSSSKDFRSRQVQLLKWKSVI